MTLNELMIRQSFITKVIFRSGSSELNKDLIVKIMSMRIEMNKIRNQFETDLKEVVEGLKPTGYQELATKQEKTKEEEEQMIKWNSEISEAYNAYVAKKGLEEIDSSHFDTPLSIDEYNEIVQVNAGNDVEINEKKITAPDFLEALYTLFVA